MSQESYGRWILLIAEILHWSPEQLESTGFLSGHWMKNLEAIAQYYYQNSRTLHHTAENCRNVAILVLVSNVKQIREEIVEPTCHQQDRSTPEYWSQYCLPSASTHPQLGDLPHPLFLLARDLPVPSLGLPSELDTTFELFKWRNSLDKGFNIWQDVLKPANTYSPLFLRNNLTILLHYLPHSRWDFGDAEKQSLYMSLFNNLLKRSTDQTVLLQLIGLSLEFKHGIDAFTIFDRHIVSAMTAVQYHVVLNALCEGLAVMNISRKSIPDVEHNSLSALSDPCIHFIRGRVLGITLPGPETGVRPEFLEGIETLLAEHLSEKTPDFVWELWAFIWVQFSPTQKRYWCREARAKPNRIVSKSLACAITN